MKSEWKVTSNYVGGKTMYGVYRTIEVGKVDHSGNRENFGRYLENREDANILCAKLNKEGQA